ncbi:MAG: hypothetical protein KUG78_18910 [Kangiellaceae bacterium]|nr:hypothetical protein [Kangiellaceae bacterium]
MKFLSNLSASIFIGWILLGCNSSPDRKDRETVVCRVQIGVNLPSTEAVLSLDNFDPEDSATFTQSTSFTLFDIFDENYLTTVYFLKSTVEPQTWSSVYYFDGNRLSLEAPTTGELSTSASLTFDPSGNLEFILPDPILSEEMILKDDDFEHQFQFEYSTVETTQYDAAFSVNNLTPLGCSIQ